MPSYQAPLTDLRFLLHDVFDADTLAELPGYAEATPDLIDQILEEAGKFVETVLAPLNQPGDQHGCTLANGTVTTPPGFADAWRAYVEAGWHGLAAEPAYGGQGLPHVLQFVLEEMVSSANLSFGTYPGLTIGATNAILQHGTEALKQRYLPKLVEGRWSGTMCLTEPQCGTDLGLTRARVEPVPDGDPGADGDDLLDADGPRYRLTGTKIFITAGDHDLTENIVHLVLARLPDAPAGIRGISLFLVPKRLPHADGSAGAPNGVTTGSIEHKMGIAGSSTCVLNFDGSIAWLVGTPHKGMRAMFTMMNAARLAVGVQGLGIAEIATQNAVAYARERLQGRRLKGGPATPDKPADPLLVHPDVRRMLMTMKAWTEGARALIIWIGVALDREAKHPDPAVRREAGEFVALMTPVAKAFITDQGVEVANLAIQVWGGHGYIRENGIEQFARDARITQIYEGANGIQALDLVGRKLGQDTGRLLRRFFHPAAAELAAAAADPALADLAKPLAKMFGRLQQVTLLIATRGLADPNEAAAVAHDYLRLFGLVALGVAWLKMAAAAGRRTPPDGFAAAKRALAQFYMDKLLPQGYGHAAAIAAGAKGVMAFDDEMF